MDNLYYLRVLIRSWEAKTRQVQTKPLLEPMKPDLWRAYTKGKADGLELAINDIEMLISRLEHQNIEDPTAKSRR
ncbi:MAG TPA: hypothetical protein VJZ27_09295 [Aggregatilineales bacterium]|nr:hypothetical protein [Aggregatilineales bacterium]